MATAAATSRHFEILITLVGEAGLADALSATDDEDTLGAITAFAPTDRAFRRLVIELERAGGATWRDAKRTAYRNQNVSASRRFASGWWRPLGRRGSRWWPTGARFNATARR